MRVFTIENRGSAGLLVETIEAQAGSSGGFTVLADPSPFAEGIPQGGTGVFSVAFTPAGFGDASSLIRVGNTDPHEDPYTFTVKGRGDGVENPHVFEVRGRGRTGSEPDISLYQRNVSLPSGGNYFFVGDVPLGSSSGPVVFTIRNEGTGVLSGIDIRFSDNSELDYMLDTLHTAQNLSAGQGATFTVTFAPARPNKKKAVLEIKSDDPDAERLYVLNLEGGMFIG